MRLAVPSAPNLNVTLGLRANAAQFTLLVVINAFVGAMVGLERAILPALAESEFHLVARSAICPSSSSSESRKPSRTTSRAARPIVWVGRVCSWWAG